jgi:hypothetical protein
MRTQVARIASAVFLLVFINRLAPCPSFPGTADFLEHDCSVRISKVIKRFMKPALSVD